MVLRNGRYAQNVSTRKALGDLGWAGVDLGKEIPETQFLGYDNTSCEAKVLAIVADDETQQAVGEGAEAILVLDQTVLYAEMGGQVADKGVITWEGGSFEVNNVQKNKGGKYLHYGKVTAGSLSVGDAVAAAYDAEYRKSIMRAHSATHLLQKALQSVLGDHVHQAGSLVLPDRLRFDFTHYSAVTAEEIAAIENQVVAAILEGYAIDVKEMSIDEAKAQGAMALFSEKYGDTVRVVNMGGYSIELCGGTHLNNTAKVGPFRIVSEGSVASGVRRIEAVTGLGYLADAAATRQTLNNVCAAVKVKKAEDLEAKLAAQAEEIKNLKKEVESFKAKEAAGAVDKMLSSAADVNGVKVLTVTVPDADAAKLRQMGDVFRDKEPAVAAVLATVNGGKVTFLAVCGKDAVKKGVKAGEIVKHVCTVCGGSGGGKPDSAMGGGKDPAKMNEALASVESFVASKLG